MPLSAFLRCGAALTKLQLLCHTFFRGVPDKEIVNFLFTLPIDRLLHLCYIVCNRDVTRMGHGR